eukprot:scaffold248378_cov33-Tisochrysis_lutea.AAC.2
MSAPGRWSHGASKLPTRSRSNRHRLFRGPTLQPCRQSEPLRLSIFLSPVPLAITLELPQCPTVLASACEPTPHNSMMAPAWPVTIGLHSPRASEEGEEVE